jgi:hypothetical protein
MKETPIVFSTQTVQAVLNSIKTETRQPYVPSGSTNRDYRAAIFSGCGKRFQRRFSGF